MSKVSITRSLLDDLAMSISAKSGEAVPMTLTEMKDAVDDIQTGGSPTLQTITKSYTPTESQQTETITAGSGYDGIEEVDVTVGAISSTYVGSGIPQRSSSDLTASGATVTVPSGYYSAQASKAVASGTAGTPTATKGSVSNHQVTVTPSVTNTAGYISGGTINGTAVTVTAAELASGNKAITENGTDIDVVGYSTVSVDVPSSGGVTVTDEANATGVGAVIVSGGGGGAQETTGTFTGNGGLTAQISCNFAPNLIYIHGDLSGDITLRGVIALTIIKDTVLYLTSDTSQSSTQETMTSVAHGITGYNESNPAGPYATYENGVLTINTVESTSSKRFASGITYNYKLIGWS